MILRVTLPLTTSPSWYLEMTISQARIRCAFLRERTISPVSSSMPSSRTSTSSPGCGRRLVFPLVERDEAFGLVADVDDDLVADDLDDLARDDAADLEALALARGTGRGSFAAVLAGDHGGQLVVADVEFTKQVTIYHGCSFRFPPRRRGEETPGKGPRSTLGPGSTAGQRVDGTRSGACGRPGVECEVPGKKAHPSTQGRAHRKKLL